MSLLTDVSSEMVSAILPLYLVFSLGASPLQFGIVDGLYQGASALVRVAAGFVADRWRRHKEIAGLGYGLSAACSSASWWSAAPPRPSARSCWWTAPARASAPRPATP